MRKSVSGVPPAFRSIQAMRSGSLVPDRREAFRVDDAAVGSGKGVDLGHFAVAEREVEDREVFLQPIDRRGLRQRRDGFHGLGRWVA